MPAQTSVAHRVFRISIATMMAASLTACPRAKTSLPAGEPSTTRPLVERMGGRTVIVAIVTEFLATVAADRRTHCASCVSSATMAYLDVPKRTQALIELIECISESGGPCESRSSDVNDAYGTLGATGADAQVLADNFVKALRKFNIQDPERVELVTWIDAAEGCPTIYTRGECEVPATVVDAYPNVPSRDISKPPFRDATEWADADDIDRDHVAQDRCLRDAEDHDGFEDTDGCPDPDNDSDGMPDAQDKCPNQAEILNGFKDGDGCPD